MQRYYNNIANQKGGAIAGAAVTVLNFTDLSTATVYSTNSAIVANVLTQPLTTLTDGSFFFYAPDGRYSLIVIPSGGTTSTVSDILLEDAVAGVNLATNMAGGSAGTVPYQIGTNTSGFSPVGTSSQVMISGGTGAPAWLNQQALVVGLASTATAAINMIGGASGQVVYQVGTGTSGFTASGTTSQILLSGGTGVPVWANQTALTVGTATSVKGTTTNDNAVAGNVGEFFNPMTSTAIPLGSGTSVNVTTATLGPGDYDCDGIADFIPGATTALARIGVGVSTTSAAFGGQDTWSQTVFGAFAPGTSVINLGAAYQRLQVSSAQGTATIWLVANAVFSTSSLSVYGSMNIRRAR